jgi:mono/diheme cytochrome c family protein
MGDPIMISDRMSPRVSVLLLAIAAATLTAACGTEHIQVPKSDAQVYHGAVLFSERCAGCHTLNAAGTHGSAPNIRTAQANSGPNFNIRCERPIDRVLYAIENGGFSGAYMPQNVVVGQDAIDVAKFVATYAGGSSPKLVGLPLCKDEPIGTLPAGSGGTTPYTPPTTSTATTSTTSAAAASAPAPKKHPKSQKKSAHA